MVFHPAFKPQNTAEKTYILFSEEENKLAVKDDSPFFTRKPACQVETELFLGDWGGRSLYCLRGLIDDEDQSIFWEDFITVFRAHDPEHQTPLSRGKQLLEWVRTHQYCGSCGSRNEMSDKEYVMRCPSCSTLSFPQIAPAIIVRITRGEEIMLAHNAKFREGLYSHVAGFAEPGETLEKAIHREVMEEVGLRVRDIRYFGSQPWPMPHSLMMGFTAECIDQSDPVPDGIEIVDAAWFTKETIPEIPTSGSIASQMLLEFLEIEY